MNKMYVETIYYKMTFSISPDMARGLQPV